MFLSTIKGGIEVDTINIDYLTKSMTSQGFELRKQKNKDLEAGLNTIAFHIEKNRVFMAVFIMKIDKNSYICAGYYNGRLVEQREVKQQSDIPSTIVNIFSNIKNRREDQPIRFDSELEKVRAAAERIEQRQKNMLSFTQEVKTTPEYQSFKRMQKKAYEKLCNDSQCIIDKRESIKRKNDALIESLLKVEACKQSLQSTLLAFEQESQYLLNVKERLKEHIQSVKARESSLTPGNMHQVSVNELIQQLTKARKMELQLKYLVS